MNWWERFNEWLFGSPPEPKIIEVDHLDGITVIISEGELPPDFEPEPEIEEEPEPIEEEPEPISRVFFVDDDPDVLCIDLELAVEHLGLEGLDKITATGEIIKHAKEHYPTFPIFNIRGK